MEFVSFRGEFVFVIVEDLSGVIDGLEEYFVLLSFSDGITLQQVEERFDWVDFHICHHVFLLFSQQSFAFPSLKFSFCSFLS